VGGSGGQVEPSFPRSPVAARSGTPPGTLRTLIVKDPMYDAQFFYRSKDDQSALNARYACRVFALALALAAPRRGTGSFMPTPTSRAGSVSPITGTFTAEFPSPAPPHRRLCEEHNVVAANCHGHRRAFVTLHGRTGRAWFLTGPSAGTFAKLKGEHRIEPEHARRR
jgi:hypothetical protein